MKQISINRFLIATVTAAILSTSGVFGNEQEISLDEVPANFKIAATKLLKDFVLKKAQIETEADGSKTYELIGEHEGIVTEIDFNEDGSLQEYEKQLALNQVPFAVRKAIHKAYPGIEFSQFEASFNDHHKVYGYEVVGQVDGKPYDLEVSPDGKNIVESDS